MSFINELRRRNVFRVGIAYAIVAWLLLQVSDTLVPALHLPEWFNSGVAFVLIIGFPIAMIFAWAFEMTPEGIKKEKDVDRSQSMTTGTGQKLNNAIIGILVLALAYFAIDKFILAPDRAQPGSDPFSQRTAGQPTDINEKRALTPVEATILTPVEADLNSVEAAAKANPAINQLARGYLAVGRFEEAEKQYLHLLALDPNHGGAHSQYAYALLAMGRYGDALAQAEKEQQAMPAKYKGAKL
jgi:tetratricopeptide (TPR) repeat protein